MAEFIQNVQELIEDHKAGKITDEQFVLAMEEETWFVKTVVLNIPETKHLEGGRR